MNDLEDTQIVELIRSSDTRDNNKAFHAIYDGTQKMVYNYVLKNNGNSIEAEDIFQDSIIILYNQIKKSDFKLTSKLSTYIFSICRNLWLKRLRKLKVNEQIINPNIEITEVDESFVSTIDTNEKKNEIQKVLNLLNPGCRQIILYYYYERMKMTEIAEAMNLSNAQVAKNKKSGCMKKLKELIHSSSSIIENLID